jgi:hypothetical protein
VARHLRGCYLEGIDSTYRVAKRRLAHATHTHLAAPTVGAQLNCRRLHTSTQQPQPAAHGRSFHAPPPPPPDPPLRDPPPPPPPWLRRVTASELGYNAPLRSAPTKGVGLGSGRAVACFSSAAPVASATTGLCSFSQLKHCTERDVELMSALYVGATSGAQLADRALVLLKLLARVQVASLTHITNLTNR